MAKIGMIHFALRHFVRDFAGTKIVGMTPEELVALANQALAAGLKLHEGYAPFCKHLFVPNHTATKAGVAKITPENEHLLRSGYEARRSDEKKVLTRWFEGVEAPRAEYLDIILYTRVQLAEEESGKPEDERDLPPEDCEYGIVSINGEPLPAETPMQPATMLRNALGKAEGGSGAALDNEAYDKSVEFWETHATVR